MAKETDNNLGFGQDELLPDREISFGDLSESTIETIKLLRDGNKIRPFGALTLVGMKAAFPERFSEDVLSDNPNLAFFSAFTRLGIDINDAVDIIPHARAEGKKDVIEGIYRGWKKIIRDTVKEARLSPTEGDEKINLVRNYQREVLTIEKEAREESWDKNDLQEIIRYREMVNAVSLVHNVAALSGIQTFSSRLEEIDKRELSLETLFEKYRWIIQGKPENEAERRLCALFNLTMGVQVIDDWFDISDDKKLGLKTIALQLLDEKEGSVKTAFRLWQYADSYFKRSEEFGVSKNARHGTAGFFTLVKVISKVFPGIGGRREFMFNGREDQLD